MISLCLSPAMRENKNKTKDRTKLFAEIFVHGIRSINIILQRYTHVV